MSAALIIMRARSAKLVLRNVSKVFAARLTFASICAAVSGSNVFKTSPVAGLIDAIAMLTGPPEAGTVCALWLRCNRAYKLYVFWKKNVGAQLSGPKSFRRHIFRQ